jgi:hypothetical protein
VTWFKLDDQFHSQPKVIAAGNAAIGLYCRLGTYCADKLTDGFIPTSVAKSMGTRRELSALTTCPIPDTRPLLLAVPGGYLLRDYLEFNPSREMVLAERAKAKERMDRLRGRRSPEQTANEHPNLARSSPSPIPVPLIPNSCTDNSLLQSVPSPVDEREILVQTIVDQKLSSRATPPDDIRAWRTTVERDVRKTLKNGDYPEHVAERAQSVPWCDDTCPECHGEQNIPHDNGDRPTPCPNRPPVKAQA